MYRKVLIIFISVYLTTFGVITQALILFLLLILFTILTVRFRPFERTHQAARQRVFPIESLQYEIILSQVSSRMQK